MEELRVKGIVLSSSDHKDKDKIDTIFTLEQGKINGILKGVKLAKSKLKFASQPFCFARFELVKTNEFYTITQVDLIESFYDLTTDYDKFMRGASMLKVCNKVLKKGIVNHKFPALSKQFPRPRHTHPTIASHRTSTLLPRAPKGRRPRASGRQRAFPKPPETKPPPNQNH